MIFFNKKKNRQTTRDRPDDESRIEMVTMYRDHFYSWNGKLYESDIVRSCVRPRAVAIGKLLAKHIREDIKKGVSVNPEPYIRFLLEEPNQYMTWQLFAERMGYQLTLNNNAFALIVRDENHFPTGLYPIPCVSVEKIVAKPSGTIYLKFQYANGKFGTFLYDDIMHLRSDLIDNDIFGSPIAPALAPLMECVTVIDQGIVKAIKNSNLIRWLLKFNSSMRPEDVSERVKDFVDNYLSYETETFGAAGVDAKVEAKQIEPKDYVPNASQQDRIVDRIYSIFNTNKKIAQSNWTEDDWNAFYEANIEPVAIQIGAVLTKIFFSRRERSMGNKIVCESSNLQCSSMKTKLEFVSMVDRGGMLLNEWRSIMNLGPIEGGDKPIRRLDTQVVALVEQMIGKIDGNNYLAMTDAIKKILDTTKTETTFQVGGD